MDISEGHKNSDQHNSINSHMYSPTPIDVVGFWGGVFVLTRNLECIRNFLNFTDWLLCSLPKSLFIMGRNIPLFGDVSICCITLVYRVHSRTSFHFSLIPSRWLLILGWSYCPCSQVCQAFLSSSFESIIFKLLFLLLS